MQDLLTSNNTYRRFLLVSVLACLLLLMISYYDSGNIISYQVFTPSSLENDSLFYNGTKYLVSNSKCRIIDLEPFSKDGKKYFKPQKYKTCSAHELLTYVTKTGNVATVHIDADIIPYYTKKKVKCCYSNVTRDTSASLPDNSIRLSDCYPFDHNITIFSEAIFIKCIENQKSGKKIYENVHMAIRITEHVQKKLNKWNYYSENTVNSSTTKANITNDIDKDDNNIPEAAKNHNRPISVLFVGIDSISRLNFVRTMPNTYEYVKNKRWLTLEGYNKMDDNTFPNLMAIFTGFKQDHAYAVCQPKSVGGMDNCPLLWYTYRDFGYVTGYAEDEASISTFNFNKKGFKEPPTDYYFRPYVLATEKLAKVDMNGMRHCTGPETAGERILNILKEFAVTFKEVPNFGIFWMNSFSHNELNAPQTMDLRVKSTLVDLENNGVYENSIVIFLSDHGMRFGDIRLTETGWLEERLPFIYFSFPPWFIEKFPTQYQNFMVNKNRLTTPYDLFMTLQDILVLSNLNYTVIPSKACPNCQSLFEQIPMERSCEDAAIEDHWCTCPGYSEVKLENNVRDRITFFLEERLQTFVIKESNKCAKLKITEYISTRVSQKFAYKDKIFLIAVIQTHPKALFEVTITIRGDLSTGNYSTGSISRLDMYKTHSKCVEDSNLKKYCYCIK